MFAELDSILVNKYQLTYQVRMIYIYLSFLNNYLCYYALLFIVCFSSLL